MSNSTKAKGRKNSKKNNLLAKRESSTKLKPYGLKKGNSYSNDDKYLLPEVNKKAERFKGKMECKNLTLDDITNTIYNSFIEDINVPIDLEIIHTETKFLVKIKSNISIYTGIGGLKLFFEQGVPFLKTSYNGKILTLKEFDKLKKQILNEQKIKR